MCVVSGELNEMVIIRVDVLGVVNIELEFIFFCVVE